MYQIEGDRFGIKRDSELLNKLAGARNEREQTTRDRQKGNRGERLLERIMRKMTGEIKYGHSGTPAT